MDSHILEVTDVRDKLLLMLVERIDKLETEVTKNNKYHLHWFGDPNAVAPNYAELLKNLTLDSLPVGKSAEERLYKKLLYEAETGHKTCEFYSFERADIPSRLLHGLEKNGFTVKHTAEGTVSIGLRKET